MSTNIIRHCARSIPPCSRYLATTAARASDAITPTPKPPQTDTTKSIPSHSTLPPAKMRALIAIYHKAESFISPENLSDAIDTAFIDKSRGHTSREMDLTELINRAQARHRRPKVSIGGSVRLTARAASLDPELEQAQSWSNMEPKRQHQVRSALFGTEGLGKPGLGVLEDEYERVMQELAHDRRDEQGKA